MYKLILCKFYVNIYLSIFKEENNMYDLKLKDCLPKSFPISQELLSKNKPDAVGSRRMLVEYQDMIFCLVLHSDNSVEILFVYSPFEKYDERFYRAEDELKSWFVPDDSVGGGSVVIESKKSGG